VTFDDYVGARWSALVRYATLLCGDLVEAEELAQAALVRVALRWERVADKDNPEPYVRKAILRGFLSQRSRLRRREIRMADLPERPAPDAVEAVAEHMDVRSALLRLPPRQRAALVLRYLDDLSELQTAEILGCSVGTVKSQTHHGLARLRELLSVDEISVGGR
jgi:RNA polymerase sigma-70 factor (sigma-E family)